MKRVHLILCMAAAALIAAPASADAVIVPQKSMKGVSLNMTTSQVRAKLGKPDKVAYPRHEILGRYKVYRYGLTRISLHSGKDGRVFSLNTESRKERLANGIGVGSREADVARRVKGVRCAVEFGLRHCYIGSFRAGKRVTDFFINRFGRVKGIVIGFVID